MARATLILLAVAALAGCAQAQPDWVKDLIASGAPLPEGGGDWAARFAAAPAPAPEGASPCPPPGFKSVDDVSARRQGTVRLIASLGGLQRWWKPCLPAPPNIPTSPRLQLDVEAYISSKWYVLAQVRPEAHVTPWGARA